MTQLRSLSMPVAAALLTWLAVPRAAHALERCEVDADCGKGLECQIVGATDCAAPACPPDAPCEPVECEPSIAKACMPAECTVDADCASGMVCHEWSRAGACETANCACSSAAPDCSCPDPVCEPPTIQKLCTPRYVLPCEAAADCGDGFTCEEQQSCGCSGSDGSAPTPGRAQPPAEGGGDSDVPPAPLGPDCSCEPSGQLACVPTEIACTGDESCPDGWSCAEVAEDAPKCSGEGCDHPAPKPSERLCFPHYYGGIGNDAGADGAPVRGEDESDSGSGAPSDPSLAGDDTKADSKDSSACQLGRAPASHGALSLLVVTGALLGLTRRRAQLRA